MLNTPEVVKFPRCAPSFDMRIKMPSNYWMIDSMKKDIGCDEVIFTDHLDHIVEAGVANVFVVNEVGEVFTPKNDGSILPGLTRQWVLQNFKVTECDINVRDLGDTGITEMFITGTYCEVKSVMRVGERQMPPETPVANDIREEYFKYVTKTKP